MPGRKPTAYVPAARQSVDQLLRVDSAAVRGRAGDPPLSGGRRSYPVLFFSPSGFPPLVWAAIAEQLASHGYVVVGVNHTYETSWLRVLGRYYLHHRPRAADGEPAATRYGAGGEHPATALVADRDGDRVAGSARAGYHPDQAQQSQVGVQQLQIGAGQVDPIEP